MFCMSMELVEEAEVKVVFRDGKTNIRDLRDIKTQRRPSIYFGGLHFERFGPDKIATTEGNPTTEKRTTTSAIDHLAPFLIIVFLSIGDLI